MKKSRKAPVVKTSPAPVKPRPIANQILQIETSALGRLERRVEEYQKDIAEWAVKAAADPVYQLSWAESIIERAIEIKEIIPLIEFLRKRFLAEDYQGAINILKAERDITIDSLLRNPPRHCSTSAMSNLVEIKTYEVKANFYRPGSFGKMAEALYKLETLARLQADRLEGVRETNEGR